MHPRQRHASEVPIEGNLPATVDLEYWKYKEPFVISRGVLTEQYILRAYACFGDWTVQGEGEPHESDESFAKASQAQAREWLASLDGFPDRVAINEALMAGGLRNALDAMAWDLEAKRSGRRVWELPEFDRLEWRPRLQTMVTITLDTPDEMCRRARALSGASHIKIKLGERCQGGLARDIERAFAVAAACPESLLVVDANEGWDLASLERFLEAARGLPIALVEQPLPRGSEPALKGRRWGVPIAADESCTDTASLERLKDCVQAVVIKLDKTGGLTEALSVVKLARRWGLKVMVGCNCGTSLAMAPAYLIGLQADWVDLDGPLHMAQDREPAMQYENAWLHAPDRALWG